ncbi:MAG: DUF2764 family protein [Candidatus Omnitrophica bacterium]|nr:DUF2764 family protein [Candidatus Omnitrophota bacterium]
MADYYYFVSSIPMLHFDIKPPFSFEDFLKMCGRFLSEDDYNLIAALPETKDARVETIASDTVKRWVIFDTLLRNELVKIRSGHRRVDPSRYLRRDGYPGQRIPHIAMVAHRSASMTEGERHLDRERWNFLDELEFGHYFDRDFLIIYAYKLKMLERWGMIRLADKETLLEKVLKNA